MGSSCSKTAVKDFYNKHEIIYKPISIVSYPLGIIIVTENLQAELKDNLCLRTAFVSSAINVTTGKYSLCRNSKLSVVLI